MSSDQPVERGSRTPIVTRMRPDAVAQVDEIAHADFGGNRSELLRTLVKLGLQAYLAGRRANG